jgi:murein DD-endopeptidase MepM/ murein hydrolase activator NlpD
MFPIKNYKYEIPKGDDLGAFGVKRKFDTHTGVDLYCNEGDSVYAIEDGKIIAIEPFTGEIAGFPWWNNTYALAILGLSGVINYGEIQPLSNLKVGDTIKSGDELGNVVPVLKKDKGKVPSTSMLHLELYSQYTGKWIEWTLNTPQPENLLNPTNLLLSNI